MGVSFKISKKGTRFHPKPVDNPVNVAADDEDDGEPVPSRIQSSSAFTSARKLSVDVTDASEDDDEISDSEVSFTLNIFPDGYSVGNPSENEVTHQSMAQGTLKYLHPYDRASDSLFSAIECGLIPGDILDDIPCKYINGTVVCEVRDYRNCVSEPGNVPSEEASPIVNKVRLKMSLENVVKDIPLISDSTWTYGDLMEVESRIVKALQPKLYLDPTPNLDRLCTKPIYSKLNLSNLRRKRLRKISEVSVASNTRIQGKKACIDRVPESSNFRLADSGSAGQQLSSYGPDSAIPVSPTVSNQSKYQTGVGNSRVMHDHIGSVFNAPTASPSRQDLMNSYTDSLNSNVPNIHGKRENQDGPLSPLSNSNKRARATPVGLTNSQQQQIAPPQMDGFTGQDWKNTILPPQQSIARGMQYGNAGMQKYPQQMFEGGFNQEGGAMSFSMAQQGMRYNMKQEPLETKPELNRNTNEMHMLESEISHMDSQQSRLQQRPPQQFSRSGFPQTPWNNNVQPLDNNPRKEEQLQKRKSAQSPRVSAGGLPQSPLSSKSGEFSSGSMGAQFGSGAMTAAHGPSQKEKSAVNSFPTVGVTTSLTSSGNDAMQRQHQAQMAKRRSNSLPKTAGINGVGSPVSVSNMGVPLNASSPVGTPPIADQGMLDRFLKIDMLTSRFQLNSKKKRIDELRKPKGFSVQQLMHHLSNDSNNENLKDEACNMPLSKSLVGGNMNIHKTRVLNFVQTERVLQGNGYTLIPKSRTRLIMSEKANDGTVAMLYGEIEEGDYLSVEDSLPTLPNTHNADLLAAQFCSLILREGYHLEGDHVQPKPVQMGRASSGQPNTPGTAPNAPGEMQPISEALQSQPSNEVAKPSNSGPNNNTLINAPQNMANTRMLPPGNSQALQQISQGGLLPPSRPQQLEPQQTSLQQQQQQQQQHALMQQRYQRSSALMLASNPHLSGMGQQNSNMQQQLGNHMLNKQSPLQLQLLQQQQQLQQQPQMQQRKMMMGLGNANMGNLGNNSMVGLQGLGNTMGMGSGRGGGTGISAPIGGPISGIGNSMGQNQNQNTLNLSQASNISNVISQQLRSGALTQEQAAVMAAKIRMAQGRTNMLGGPVQSSGLGGMAGANRQMQPGSSGLSMLGPTLNRASNINPMQRTAMPPMGPPKLMSNMNLYMNQQQQQQQQQQQMHLQQQQMQMQQQQLQQFQQQQQQQQQHQETTSPLHAVLSPPQQVGSPSMGVPQQQQASPQQLSQRTPMSPQLSSGGIHPPPPISSGNQDANGPASPQLSSQTMGSVGSITNSSMDLQGVNKSG